MSKELGLSAAALTAALGALLFTTAQAQAIREVVLEMGGAGTGTLENGHKVCSYFMPGNWRDSLVVPKTWNKGHCRSLANQVGASHIQLGCAFPDEVVLGPQTELRADPEPSKVRNCGW